MLTTQTAAGLTAGGQPNIGINMKIEMTKQTVVNGQDVRIGQIIETGNELAKWLIHKAWAIEVKKAKKKAKK